ncbi:MAG: autotransporter outer membrane beta-barrel domain-containing protein, partial [Alphaproteobacteria bacterium]|nr:autotransporter outer membrane beta-barrel domain-containing protein [Alphaproteobacteria bacterium]
SAVDYTYKYDLSFVGDDTVDADLGTTTQFVAMNNAIINAENVSVDGTTLKFGAYTHGNDEVKGKFIASLKEDGTENLTANSVTSLMLNNAVFDVANGYIDEIYLKGYSSNNSFYHVDVLTDKLEADVLHINGDVDPNNATNVIVHASSDADIRGESILFVHSTNDTTGQADSFKISRVYGSPYLYDVLFNVEDSSDGTATVANTNENKWYLSMNSDENPNKGTPPSGDDDDNNGGNTEGPSGSGGISVSPNKLVTPEIIGSISLPTVATTQKVGMINTIMRKVGMSDLYTPVCGFCSYNWDGKPNHNAWVDTDYTDLSIDALVDIEAKVWGIEAGFDLQHDRNNKLGVFVSYRTGNYDMNGDGKEYYSTKSSEIEAKSYLGGLYYFHDKNNFYTFATLFGGIQQAELETADGFKADTDGVEYGASLELGYKYALTKNLYLQPSVSVTYDQVSYDDAKDNVGKKYEYEDIKQVELELGAKLGKSAYLADGYYNIYVKPSVVQTYNDGDEVEVTGLGNIDTLEDQTLGRVEVGGNYGIGDNWSVYGWANHTFGDDYKASTFGIGLNYNL